MAWISLAAILLVLQLVVLLLVLPQVLLSYDKAASCCLHHHHHPPRYRGRRGRRHFSYGRSSSSSSRIIDHGHLHAARRIGGTRPVFRHSKSFCDVRSIDDNEQKRSTTIQFMSTQSSSSSPPPLSTQSAQLPPPPQQPASSDHRDKSMIASQRLGVRPSRINFPPWFWKLSWKVHSMALPILHRWDEAPTPDLANCLKCLWCKALSANDISSPVYEGRQGWTYDMLPSVTRWFIVKNPFLPLWIFPRLVHYVIELRTTFLNRSLRNEIRRYQEQEQEKPTTTETIAAEAPTTKTTTTTTTTTAKNGMNVSKKQKKIRLISLGAGYDTRSIQFLNVKVEEEDQDHKGCGSDTGSVDRDAIRIDEAYELDLPEVVSSKSIMLERLVERRRKQHPNKQKEIKLPKLMSQNLKDVRGLKESLDKIFMRDGTTTGTTSDCCHTIFLVEGVLIYLSEPQRSDVLSTCSQYLKDRGVQGSLLFADRIRKPPDPSVDDMKDWLNGDGWTLDEESFTVHPGKARHMGIARV